MGVIKHGAREMVMLGAYTTYVVQESIRQKAIPFFVPGTNWASPFRCVRHLARLGACRSRCHWRSLSPVASAFSSSAHHPVSLRRPLETLLATWGLSLILQQAVRTQFGPTNKEVSNPSWMSGAFDVGHMTITYNRLWIIVFTMFVFVLLLGMLRFHEARLEMRAVTQNRTMAASMGIRTSYIDALTFGLGSASRALPAWRSRRSTTSAPISAELHHRLLHGGGVRRRR